MRLEVGKIYAFTFAGQLWYRRVTKEWPEDSNTVTTSICDLSIEKVKEAGDFEIRYTRDGIKVSNPNSDKIKYLVEINPDGTTELIEFIPDEGYNEGKAKIVVEDLWTL